MKTTNQTIAPATDKVTSLDVRFFEALRLEVKDVAQGMPSAVESLSPKLLRAAAERLMEVARFAEAFAKSDVVPQAPAKDEQAVVVKIAGAPAGEGSRVLEDGAAILALRAEGKTWGEAAKARGLSASQATYAARQAKKAAAKAERAARKAS